MCLIRYRALVQVRKTAVKVQPYLEGEATNCLTEHYIWRAIEQASRTADKIDARWPATENRHS